MAITGEKSEFLISGLGDQNFMVIGLDKMQQNHIFEAAHDGKIVQILTLSKILNFFINKKGCNKLKNKYFATRCQYGDFGIWGSNKHPDRVLKILNLDDVDFP